MVSTIDFWSAGPGFKSWLYQISFLIEDMANFIKLQDLETCAYDFSL